MAQPEARPAAAAAPGLSTTAPPRLPWEGRPGCWVSTSRSKEGVVSTRGWFPAVCPCDAHRLWQQLSWAAFLSVWEALGGPFVWGADAGFPGGSVVDATWGSFSLDLTSVGDMAGGGGPCCVKKGSGPVRPALSEPVVGGAGAGKGAVSPEQKWTEPRSEPRMGVTAMSQTSQGAQAYEAWSPKSHLTRVEPPGQRDPSHSLAAPCLSPEWLWSLRGLQ